MKLKMSEREATVVRLALLDAAVNSPNLDRREIEVIAKVYRRIRRKQSIKDRLLGKWK